MDFSTIIGIDVSKLTLDVHVLPTNQTIQISNEEKGIEQLIRWLIKTCKTDLTNALFAFECTGFYSHKLSVHLQTDDYTYVMLPGLEIKRSLGIARGKDDKIDARKIAEYAEKNLKKIVPTELPEKDILHMKRLLSAREKLCKQRAGYRATLKEARRAIDPNEAPLYYDVQIAMENQLTQQINRLENELTSLVENNPELKKQFDLIMSIKGVGPVTALTLIAVTHCFQKFPNARKFACYCGIAPFPHRSGTSIKGRTKVSHLANKHLKSLLSTIATSAIQHNTELKAYYKTRVENGDNKMLVLNIIRNKLVSRIFAVVHRGTPYVDTMKYAM